MAFVKEIYCPECKQTKQETRSTSNEFEPFCSDCQEKKDLEKENTFKKQFFTQFKDMTPQQKMDWILNWICEHEVSVKTSRRSQDVLFG